MSETIALTLRRELGETIEVDGLTPDRLSTLSEAEVSALPVWVGRQPAAIGDFFTVRGERAARVWIEGDLRRVRGVADAMSTGELIVEGHVGDGFAAGLRGGSVVVRGDAGDRLGAATPGASKGMTGGEIIVTGSVGARAAERMRRGLLAVGGDAGEYAAHAIIAGTLVVLGRTGAHAGRASKRGSIVAVGAIDIPPTYRYACTYEPTYLRLLFNDLRRRHQLPLDDSVIAGRYRRYCGDAGEPGKGEILVRDTLYT
jgi:formylmethanofuran dehydrogenase subunit C